MNEQIKELLLQADIQFDKDINEIDVCVLLPSDLEKFAELIVQECAITVIDRCEMRNADDVRRAEYHAKRIKQHFGVEE